MGVFEGRFLWGLGFVEECLNEKLGLGFVSVHSDVVCDFLRLALANVHRPSIESLAAENVGSHIAASSVVFDPCELRDHCIVHVAFLSVEDLKSDLYRSSLNDRRVGLTLVDYVFTVRKATDQG